MAMVASWSADWLHRGVLAESQNLFKNASRFSMTDSLPELNILDASGKRRHRPSSLNVRGLTVSKQSLNVLLWSALKPPYTEFLAHSVNPGGL